MPLTEILMSPPNFIIAVVMGTIVIGSIVRATTSVINNASRERSRREIAAYIAEGSLTPEQGERILRADVSSHQREA